MDQQAQLKTVDRAHPLTTSDLARLQVERQRAQIQVDDTAVQTIKAYRAYEAAKAEEAMATAAFEHHDGKVRAALAELKTGTPG
jgi:hypothetical protein